MPRWTLALAVAAAIAFASLPLSVAPSATSPKLEDELLHNATHVFQRAVDRNAPAISAGVLLGAEAIAVFPRSTRSGSGYSGTGVVSVRGAHPSYWTPWTPPAVIALEATIPLDLESDTVDFVLVAQTQRGVHRLIQPHFASPVTIPIAPGVLGRDMRVRPDADLLAYMQFGDYFSGVTIVNWTISEVRYANRRLYGRPYSTDDIVSGVGFFHLPHAAREWRGAIAAYFREMS